MSCSCCPPPNDSFSDASSEAASSDTDSLPEAKPTDYTHEDTEWQDVESDKGEALEFVSLIDDKSFNTMSEMLDHCKSNGLDIRNMVKELGLDFYGAIKLVNYIRSEVKAGRTISLADETQWADDNYLQPVLEDDAVLFSLDELLESVINEGEVAPAVNSDDKQNSTNNTNETFEEMKQVDLLKRELQALQRQFGEYRAAVEDTLDKRWSSAEAGPSKQTTMLKDEQSRAEGARAPTSSLSSAEAKLGNGEGRDDDTHYFDSYSYNDIHETMLKDTVRTSSYRDFIYNHKNLFASRTVLDVGTGTGILALFSARAGASRVFAVDNSSIISKARENVAANGASDVVTCVRGKIEDVELPGVSGKVVDVIVSEWMGYCLLYESMLDSVLAARDRFLAPGGIMAPSHMTIRLAPVSDSEYIEDSIGFWSEVYGFDMRAMTEKIHEDVVVRSVAPESLVAQGTTVKTLDLYTVKVAELDFEAAFEMEVEREMEGLDAWVIWFDTFFLAGRDAVLDDDDVCAETWPGAGKEDCGVAFTTGPDGKETHWRAGLCVVDHRNKGKMLEEGDGKVKIAKKPTILKKGQKIVGRIGYCKRESNSRELDVEISWEVMGTGERGRQKWCMR